MSCTNITINTINIALVVIFFAEVDFNVEVVVELPFYAAAELEHFSISVDPEISLEYS